MLVTGMGRGAMMATLRCDHPDIEAFITAKADAKRLRNFNVSVLITDEFMSALKADSYWDLVWAGQTVRRVNARDIWEKIMWQAYETAEPGVLFIDRVNAANPLSYIEQIAATNSCAEQPLPAKWRLPAGLDQSGALGSQSFHGECDARFRSIAPSDRNGGADAG